MLPRTLGRYEVTAVLGHGGMGSVYRARDPRIGRDVAIKLLREGYDSVELRDRFAREARSAGSLSHPNIVTIFDIGDHEGRPFIAMEYVAGQTFAELIRSQSPLTFNRMLQMMEEVCAGLAHAHEAGIVHRDIKPANLIVDPEGTVKILDFGIARLNASGMTQPGMVIGTLNYMSPEQIGGTAVDRRTDIFAVGAVLYELLSLHKAFPGKDYQSVFRQLLNRSPKPLTEYCPGIDPRLVRIIDQALEKKPARRFQTAEALQRELAAVRLSAPATTPSRSGVPERTPAADESQMMTRPAEERPSSRTVARPRTDPATVARLSAQQIESHLTTAEQAYDAGDYEKAIESCEQVLLLDPAEPRAAAQIDRIHAAIDERQVRGWLAEARQQLSRGAVATASDLVESALLLSPDHPEVAALTAEIFKERARVRTEAIRAVHERARAAFAAGDLAAALVYANQALALDPAGADPQRLKTDIETAIAARDEEARIRAAVDQARRAFIDGEHDEALRQLESQPASNPLVAKALEELRGALRAIEQRRRAEQERLERLQRVTALVADARRAREERQFDQALGALDQAREIDPAFPELSGLTELVRREQAAAQLEADLVRSLADIDERLGHDDLSGAEESLRAATALARTDPRVGAALARVEVARAERAAREAAEARARESEEQADKAAELLKAGDFAGAQRSLTSAGQLNPENPRVALLASQVQDAIDARTAAEAAARLRQQVAELVSAAAQPLHSPAPQSDDLMLALRRIDEALALDPANTEARDLKPALENALASKKDEARLRAAVSNARRRFGSGKHRAAIELLESLQPSSDPLVVEALNELRHRLRQIESSRPSETAPVRPTEPAPVEPPHELDATIVARPAHPAPISAEQSAPAARTPDTKQEATEQPGAAEKAERQRRQQEIDAALVAASQRLEAADFTAAEELLASILRREPSHAGAQRLKGQLDQAIRAAKKETAQHQQLIETRLAAAAKQAERHKYSQAARELEEVLRIQPGHERATQLLADVRREEQQRVVAGKVDALLKEATAAESNERAIAILQQALTLAPNDPRVAEMLLNRKAALSPELGDRALDLGPARRALPEADSAPTQPRPAMMALAFLNQRPVLIGGSVLVLALALLGFRFWTRPASTEAPREMASNPKTSAPPDPVAAPPSVPSPAPVPVPAPVRTYTATIVGKYKFEVEFPGGKRPAATRHPLTLPAGTTTQVRLTNESVFLDAVIPVRGEADESKTLSAPAMSSLTIYNSFNESCEILIDGRPAGYHPVTQRLVSGLHEVSLKCANGRVPKPQRVDVPAAREGRVTFTKND